MKKLLAALVLLSLRLPPCAAAADSPARFEAYPVGFADPAAVEQMARAIVGPAGTVVADPKSKRLFVLAPEDRHALIREMVGRLDMPPRNVRVEVAFKGGGAASDREASVSADGAVVVGGGGSAGRIRIRPRILDTLSRTTSDVKQTLLVASGREGVLEVGQSVPHLAWLETYALQHGYLAARVDWQHVGARLVVEPEIVGGGPAIRLRLTPELSGLVDGQPMRTRFSRVSTEVTVNSGDSFRIGGLDQDAAFYERFLVGASRSGRQESLEVVLTPTIVDAGGVGAP